MSCTLMEIEINVPDRGDGKSRTAGSRQGGRGFLEFLSDQGNPQLERLQKVISIVSIIIISVNIFLCVLNCYERQTSSVDRSASDRTRYSFMSTALSGLIKAHCKYERVFHGLYKRNSLVEQLI